VRDEGREREDTNIQLAILPIHLHLGTICFLSMVAWEVGSQFTIQLVSVQDFGRDSVRASSPLPWNKVAEKEKESGTDAHHSHAKDPPEPSKSCMNSWQTLFFQNMRFGLH